MWGAILVTVRYLLIVNNYFKSHCVVVTVRRQTSKYVTRLASSNDPVQNNVFHVLLADYVTTTMYLISDYWSVRWQMPSVEVSAFKTNLVQDISFFLYLLHNHVLWRSSRSNWNAGTWSSHRASFNLEQACCWKKYFSSNSVGSHEIHLVSLTKVNAPNESAGAWECNIMCPLPKYPANIYEIVYFNVYIRCWLLC